MICLVEFFLVQQSEPKQLSMALCLGQQLLHSERTPKEARRTDSSGSFMGLLSKVTGAGDVNFV
jgi:hypothetical protein